MKQVSANYGYTEKSFNNVDRGYLLELGYLEAGDTVTLHSKTEGQSVSADVYRFDYNALRALQDVLQDESLELTSWKDTKLSGTITTEKGGVMMTSIPYDPGWKIFVDGVETDITEVKDTFLGVELTPGTHTIELRFMPQGLVLGGLITVLSLVMLLAIWLITRRFGLLSDGLREYEELTQEDEDADPSATTEHAVVEDDEAAVFEEELQAEDDLNTAAPADGDDATPEALAEDTNGNEDDADLEIIAIHEE